ncbi:MAG: ABC transporter ATP-binding protein [Mobilicoccus sp.]|nr:ABC transporter ATP-binding protein [Mobilicoccus sp.]
MTVTDTTTQALALRGVTVRFGGITALSDVSMEVIPGEVHGVIGPNGAGKTTLFNVCCGFVRPTEGDLVIAGTPRPGLKPTDLAGLGISRTLQGLGLFERLPVLTNVQVGAERHAKAGFVSGLLGLPTSSKDEKALRERSMAALARLGIAEHAGTIAGSLPYALRKRVALARALVAEPTMLLLDEPASGLSEAEMSELGALIRDLSGDLSIMLVEHHMDLVMSVCDRITVLDFGKVISRGTPDEVRDDPLVLEAYLGADDIDADAGEGTEV